jgi:hypothetical protein
VTRRGARSARAAPTRAAELTPAAGGIASRWIGVATLALLFPTLARTPQSGDGAEIVTVALRGGVLHPTGFPLQAWIDRLLVLAPGMTPSLAIAAFGLLAHAAAAGLIADALRRLGVASAGRVLGATAFALFPSLWTLAVEPEVFALAHLALAATMWTAVRFGLEPAPRGARFGMALGLLGAAAAAQHPVALAGVPALAIASWRGREGRAARVGVFVATLALGAVAAYASLPLLRTSSPWPDWGRLASARDVLAHAMRVDYGSFSLSAAQDVATRSGLALWIREVATWWNVGLVLVAIGAWALLTRRELRPARSPLSTLLLAGLVILWRGRLPEQTYSDAYLEKLQGPAMLAAALLLGLGAQRLAQWMGPRRQRALDVAVVAAIAAWLVLGWPRADASHDGTLELYARGIGQELPHGAVYVTEGEVEAFLGVPSATGVRFPLSATMTPLDWYSRETAPRLEPRMLNGARLEDWDQFLVGCFKQGLSVASASPGIVTTPFGVPELRGLIYVASAGARAELTDTTITAAVRLAPLAAELPLLRPGTRPFSHFYVRRFARAFAGAAEALRRRGASELAAEADSIASSLDRGRDVRDRRRRLDQFVARARGAGFGH